MDSRDLAAVQPMPTPRDVPSVQGMVIADLKVRLQVGIERYGTPLQPHNGRDALRDLYEELLDAACYARQAIEERPREDVDSAVLAVRDEIAREINRRDDLIAELRRQLDASVRTRDRYVADSRRVPGLEKALHLAGNALVALPQRCRYHGTDFGDTKFGEPRCESCRQPYLVGLALRAINAAESGKNSASQASGSPGRTAAQDGDGHG